MAEMEMRIEHRGFNPVLVAVDGYGRTWVFALRQIEGPGVQLTPNEVTLSEAPIG